MLKKILILIALLVSFAYGANTYDDNYRYRKYSHVKDFYKPLVQETIKLSLKYNMPPAAILAIASVESGYGRGYVAKITANILSLGANKGERELPSVYLPNHIKTKEVIYNPQEIKKFAKNQLKWKQRPKSLKKDYRPNRVAGSTEELEYFDNHLKERIEANLKNIKDFSTRWISLSNRHVAFSDARKLLDKKVNLYGKKILFDKELNIEFINQIGGKPQSFNYRKSWPKKVISVLNNSGLVELTSKLYLDKKSFDEAW